MDNNTVLLAKCDDYNSVRLQEILKKQLECIGVLGKVKPGMKIALKLNLVTAMKPDTAGTTHPAVIEALCNILIGMGAEVVLGDSPGGPFTSAYLKGVYHICGIDAVAERTGAKLNMDFSQTDVFFDEGVIARSISVTSWLLNADAIINCCKLKTHGMMAMSAAVKNMFGSIPGTMKPEYHFRFPQQSDFANMLIDLQEYWKPKMLAHVVDGIVGMEGNGPTAGTPRHVGILMSGVNPYSLDLVGGRIIGLECDDVMTMSLARERGIGASGADEIDICIEENRDYVNQHKATADILAPFVIPDYELLDNTSDLQFGGNTFLARMRGKLIQTFMASRPEPDATECIGCGKCEQICPARAICMVDGIPKIDRSKCIKCFCCQEFCPKGAMKVRRTAIAKLLAH